MPDYCLRRLFYYQGTIFVPKKNMISPNTQSLKLTLCRTAKRGRGFCDTTAHIITGSPPCIMVGDHIIRTEDFIGLFPDKLTLKWDKWWMRIYQRQHYSIEVLTTSDSLMEDNRGLAITALPWYLPLMSSQTILVDTALVRWFSSAVTFAATVW